MEWYNGYSDAERERKGEAGRRARNAGTLPVYTGPCMLCGDPEVEVEPHSEDYSTPYLWEPPAVYWICRHCHRNKLHKRFFRTELWEVFKAHVRRGGYARDLHDPLIELELANYRRARASGGSPVLRQLRNGRLVSETEWWERLRTDEASLTDPNARPRPYRGSRKHVLDWTSRGTLPQELLALVGPVFGQNSVTPLRWMPRGYREPDEARVHSFGRAVWPNHAAWAAIDEWWLVHKRGANTPNWDIAFAAEVGGRPTLVLVEAKAHASELKEDGKSLREDASANSAANHERIIAAIGEARAGLRCLDGRVAITHESHYQLANRIAFAWKLSSLGISTVLVYLGFIGDNGISDIGVPFTDDAHWQAAFMAHSRSIIPLELFDRSLTCGKGDARLLVRSRTVTEQSAMRS